MTTADRIAEIRARLAAMPQDGDLWTTHTIVDILEEQQHQIAALQQRVDRLEQKAGRVR